MPNKRGIGAPVTMAVTEKDEGAYELRGPKGRTLLRLETEKTAGWDFEKRNPGSILVRVGTRPKYCREAPQ